MKGMRADGKEDEGNASKDEDMFRLINKMMRHDIRNNLSIAYGYMGLIKEGKASRENVLIERAYNAVGKAIDITRKMTELETLAMNGVHLEMVEVSRVIEESSRNVDMEVNIRGNCEVMADYALFSVFENLLSNSRIHGEATCVDVEIGRDGDHCSISFSDNGKGIPEEIADTLFDEGTVYGEKAGTGLGLYIAKRTIERYGGSISVERGEEGGARFLICLPIKRD